MMRSRPPLTTSTLILALSLLAACDSTPSGPVGPPESCDETEPILIGPGESVTLHGSLAGLLCIEGSASAGEYLAIAVAATTNSLLSFTVIPRNTVRVSRPIAAPARTPQQLHVEGLLPDDRLPNDRFHLELRELEQRELSHRVRVGGASEDFPRRSPRAPIPREGDLLQLNAQAANACEEPSYRTGRVEAISERAIVVADTENPSGGFDASDFRHLAATFDTLIAPLAERNFGQPTDLDGNGRTIIFFTKEVNRLTDPGSASFTAGFFFSRDLFPRTDTPRFAGCAHSNEGEIIYLLVPDPTGEVGGNVQERHFVQHIMPAIMIHEYQHLINAARRLHHLQLRNWEERPWLNEALSHIAEELLFFETSGLEPGGRISFSTLQAAGLQAFQAIDRHQRFNLLRYHQFLEDPEENSPYNDEVQPALATRGAAWNFLRYSADRRGGDQVDFFNGLVSAPEVGIDKLATALGGRPTFDQWLSDWSTANLASDRVARVTEWHRHPSWNFRSLFGPVTGLSRDPTPIIPLTAGSPESRHLTGGGAAYLRFGVGAGEEASLEFRSGDDAPPATFRVTVLRTR